MRLQYFLKRIGLLILIVWGAATVNFIIPRLSPSDPIRSRLSAMAVQSGYVQTGIEQMVKAYQAKFGLDKPLWVQYLNYLKDMFTFNFGYSLSLYPARVLDLILNALPWTIGLLTTATLLAFLIGTISGALMAWPRAPRALTTFAGPLLTLSAIPYYLLGLILLYVFAFLLKLLPLYGGYPAGTVPSFSLAFIGTIFKHSILPALSIVLAEMGFWAIGMRSMMITTEGEDYMVFAEARGLRSRSIFTHYALRNAMLPQYTSLALSIGRIVSGSVLVEVIFAYPGVGTLLYTAIKGSDYFVIYGVVFMVILTLGMATTLLEFLYPLLDPRIRQGA
ncbi:MAG TPA: ABC transporter permease [Thermomicrobiales bacterium]|nr:ABC transporter permease [Thermomicrobiales bacterium]